MALRGDLLAAMVYIEAPWDKVTSPVRFRRFSTLFHNSRESSSGAARELTGNRLDLHHKQGVVALTRALVEKNPESDLHTNRKPRSLQHLPKREKPKGESGLKSGNLKASLKFQPNSSDLRYPLSRGPHGGARGSGMNLSQTPNEGETHVRPDFRACLDRSSELLDGNCGQERG